MESFAVNDCPVSVITPESRQLVQILTRAHSATETAALYGPNLSKWPARMLDAQVVINQERAREDRARYDAEMKTTQHA